MSARDQLAAARAAADQAIACATVGRVQVSVPVAAWDALLATLGVLDAGAARVPRGDAVGMTLAEIALEDNGEAWLEWAVDRSWPPHFQAALAEFVESRTGTR